MYLGQTDFVQSCTVVLSHVSIRVKQLFHWAPLRALRSRMSTCWWYRTLSFFFCDLCLGNSFLFNVSIFSSKKIESNRYQGSVSGTLFPSVRSSESGVVIRSCHASDPLLVFAAVKKMAPSSREAIGPEVPDECPFSAPSPRWTLNGPEVPDACLHKIKKMTLKNKIKKTKGLKN